MKKFQILKWIVLISYLFGAGCSEQSEEGKSRELIERLQWLLLETEDYQDAPAKLFETHLTLEEQRLLVLLQKKNLIVINEEYNHTSYIFKYKYRQEDQYIFVRSDGSVYLK